VLAAARRVIRTFVPASVEPRAVRAAPRRSWRIRAAVKRRDVKSGAGVNKCSARSIDKSSDGESRSTYNTHIAPKS